MKVKDGLEEEYKGYVEKNSDGYSKGCVEAGEAVGIALDNGNTPEEAIEFLHGHGLTGFMAGAAIQGVCHFHPRGEELRIAWNKRYNVGSDKKGVVNPAIITVADNGEVNYEAE